MPYTVGIYINGTKFTAAKILLILMLGPALVRFATDLGQGRRRLLASDIFVLATAVWMVLAPVTVAGSVVTVSVTSQALEFFGGYALGRIYISRQDTLPGFCKVLAPLGLVMIGLAIVDEATEQFYVLGLTARLFNLPGAGTEIGDYHAYRSFMGHNFFRTTATFDHPILFGAFTCCVATIQLFTESGLKKRIVYVSLLFVGCFLSMSSAPLLTFMLAIGLSKYDGILKSYPLRWRILTSAFCLILGGFSLASNNPTSWFIRNLTLDPQSGYFRMLIWDAAFEQIGKEPLFGNGFAKTGNYILDVTVDCLWLARAIDYGLPLIVFLLLAICCALAPVAGQVRTMQTSPELSRFRAALSVLLVLLLFTSLTVYFWNGMWVFLCLCIGIRASLKEASWFSLRQQADVPVPPRSIPLARLRLAGGG